MPYDVPGRADAVSSQITSDWNAKISAEYAALETDFGSRFFSIDPSTITLPTSTNSIKWFADPAEPLTCLDRDYARRLSDWGLAGRQKLHNEYAEYRVVQRPDPSTGQLRSKRVQVTTELREYWVCVAKREPDTLRSMVQSVLGFLPAWEDLYGVSDPQTLTIDQREVAFSKLVAGHGNDRHLADQGVPAQPTGRLNTENALFMTHPINGLDDLIYIVMFGAKPYARRVGAELQPATRNQIFRAFGVEHLACRHADPAAALGAHAQAFEGRTVGFANPLGMYIATFTSDLFSYQGESLPTDWVRLGRGEPGSYQRLEFGPPDDHPAFLDEIQVEIAGVSQPVLGGYQVVQQVEVGPIVLVGAPTAVAESEFVLLETSTGPINCREASICPSIQTLKAEYDASQPFVRTGPRRMGREG